MTADARVEAIRRRLTSDGIAAFAANSPANVGYLTRFDEVFDQEAASVAVITPDALVLFTDGRYVEAARSAAEGSPWDVRLRRDDLWDSVAEEFLAGSTEGRLAVESTLTVETYVALRRKLEQRVQAVDAWVESARRVKDDEEIGRIEAAQQLTDAAFEHVLGIIGPGTVETTLALDIEVFLRTHGSQGVAFPPIVASGPNSSRPHALPGDREIAVGDLVVMDFGARVDGYCADLTRTVVVGSASRRQREVYEAVLAANEAGIAAISEGRTGVEADAAARAVFVERGLGDAFTHGLGHGVGREVHEMPSVSARGTEKLQAGEVVTVEPGAYVPGFGGVRIEDLVVVEPVSCRVLTASTKDLIEV